MEMAFMARRVQLRNSALCLCLLLSACRQQQTLQYVNADSAALNFVHKVAMHAGAPFSGRVYQLAANGTDTLYCRDYRSGQPDGRHISWYDNGQVEAVRFYSKAHKTGTHHAFWPNGNRRFCFNYQKDHYEGAEYDWYENGRICSIRHYHNGQEDGMQQVFSPEGKRISNYEAKNGRNYGNIGTKHCTPVDVSPTLQ